LANSVAGLPDGYTSRPATPADVDAVLSILHARDLREVGEPEATEFYISDIWQNPRFDQTKDTLIVEGGSGHAVAYVDVNEFDAPDISSIWAPIHPDHLGRGIGSAVLAWAEVRASRAGRSTWHQHTDGGDTAAHALLEAHHYERVRTNLHMLLDLNGELASPEPPPGVRLRSMADGDERAVHHVLSEAFQGHFALEVDPFDEWWSGLRRNPSFDPELYVLAEHDADIVGVSGNFVEGSEGWVGDLGVLEGHRGRGIAKALLAASFRDFARRGLARARLNVDAQNETGAVDLYRAVGMREHRRFPIFEKRSGGKLRLP
jgi:mycothiol synthase